MQTERTKTSIRVNVGCSVSLLFAYNCYGKKEDYKGADWGLYLDRIDGYSGLCYALCWFFVSSLWLVYIENEDKNG